LKGSPDGHQTPECLNPTLPVIALSGRAELSDVMAARDVGINEFVVKPFTIQTIFDRLERVIEFPRNFLVSQNYIGPERRFRSTDWTGTNRRITNPVKQPMALATARDWKDTRMPRLLVNDYVLKRKLGKSTSLGDIITPKVLESAQDTVFKLANSSLEWVSRSIETLQTTFSRLKENPNDKELHDNLIQIAYDLEGIAGTFSFHNAASIARLLRLFFQDNFQSDNDLHHIVAEKHIDVLLVTFSQILKGSEVNGFEEILQELNYLTLRVS
jgi:CheY-like chemotaxis protein